MCRSSCRARGWSYPPSRANSPGRKWLPGEGSPRAPPRLARSPPCNSGRYGTWICVSDSTFPGRGSTEGRCYGLTLRTALLLTFFPRRNSHLTRLFRNRGVVDRSPRVHVPHGAAPLAARDCPHPVRRERHRVHLPNAQVVYRPCPPTRRLPRPHGGVVARGHHEPSVRAVRRPCHEPAVAPEDG